MSVPDVSLLDAVEVSATGARPLYAQLADNLRDVVSSHFTHGDLFYSEKTLIEQLPVSQITVRRALLELRAEGLLVPCRGRGTTIRKPQKAPEPLASLQSRTSLEFNRSARPQARRSKKTLGIFVPETLLQLSEHARSLMLEYQNQGASRGLEIKFHVASDTAEISRIFRSVSGSRDEEAFVLYTTSDTTHLLHHALENRGYRTVALEGIGPNYPGRVVATDAAQAVRIGVDHLVGLGHRRIVLLVNEPVTEFNVQDKMHTFQTYTETLGIAEFCRVLNCENGFFGDSYNCVFEHMAEAMSGYPHRPTAIFTVSDAGAWAVLNWCSRHGITVPSELSVVGFENMKSSLYMHPPLTSVAHPDVRLVELSLEVLWDTVSDHPKRILVPPTIVVRESTGPPPESEWKDVTSSDPRAHK